MRITNKMLSQNLLRNLESAQGKMDQIQNQMSSGLRISRPSDDPVGIQNAMRLKSNISSVEQWKSNADSALSYMSTTDSTLGDVTSILQRVRELTVQGANGSLATDDRNAIKNEVDQISHQLHLMANTQVGSKYIFSGTATDKKLQNWDAVSETWETQDSTGNDQEVEFEIGSNLSLPISVNGRELFGDTTKGIFATLGKLSTALENGDSTGISNLLDDIDSNVNSVIAVRSELGARTNRMTALREQLDTMSTNLQKNLSSIEDADIAKTIIDFKSQENVYKAALSVGAQIIQPSLVDFMR